MTTSYKRSFNSNNNSSIVTITLEPLVSPFKYIKSNNKNDVHHTPTIKFPKLEYVDDLVNNDDDEDNEFDISIPIRKSTNKIQTTPTKLNFNEIKLKKGTSTFSIEDLTINDNNNNSDNSDNEDEYDFEITPIKKSSNNKIKIANINSISDNNDKLKLILNSYQSNLIINKYEKEREIQLNKLIDEKTKEIDEKWNSIKEFNNQLGRDELSQFHQQQIRLNKLIEKEQLKKKSTLKIKLKKIKEKHKKELRESITLISKINKIEQLEIDRINNILKSHEKAIQEQKQKQKELIERHQQKLKQQQDDLKKKLDEEKLKKEKEEQLEAEAEAEQERQRQAQAEAQALQQAEAERQAQAQAEAEEALKKQQEAEALQALQAKEQQQVVKVTKSSKSYSKTNGFIHSTYNDSESYRWFNEKYNNYLEVNKVVKGSVGSSGEGDEVIKRNVVKKINIAINQISASDEQVREKKDLLIGVLNEMMINRKSEYLFKCALIAIVEKSLGQVDAQITYHNASSFPLALVLIQISEKYPQLLHLLLGKLRDQCIYTVPLYVAPKEVNHGTDSSNDNISYKMGYIMTSNNEPAETEDDYIKRMCGYISLYSALILKSEQPSSSSGGSKPITTTFFGSAPIPTQTSGSACKSILNIDIALRWINDIVSIRPRRITSYLLVTFLSHLGHLLSKSNKSNQFNQLIRKIIEPTYFEQLSKKNTEASVARLKDIIEQYFKTSTFQEPEGVNF